MLKLIEALPETALVVRNGQLATEDQHPLLSDLVKIVSVISGG